MPTYDYECLECGYIFERFQKIMDDPVKDCPRCGKQVKRLIGGGIGIIFKGNGFYSTDNKKSGASPSDGKEKNEPAPVSSTEKTSADKKEAAGAGKTAGT